MTRNKLANKLANKDTLCRRIAHCRLEETVAVNSMDQDASNEGRNRTQHTGTGHRETQTIWTHEGARGTGGNTLGIREDNQTLDTVGRARYLKREGKLVNFKIKQEMTRQDMNQNVNRDKTSFNFGFRRLTIPPSLALDLKFLFQMNLSHPFSYPAIGLDFWENVVLSTLLCSTSSLLFYWICHYWHY